MRFAPRHLLSVLLLTALPGLATAAPLNGDAVLTLLERDEAAGRIDRETRLLETFRYVFAPGKLAPQYAPEERSPLRCLTPTIAEYQAHRAEWSDDTVAEVERYLTRPAPTLRTLYTSPGGNFSFNYFTTGGNAVPSTDISPANGIPDFVERCAEYMDTSWDTEVTALGFVAPTLPADGTYDVSFQSMGAYGFTTPSGFTTEIVLHNNFFGFPANTDPDGNQLGAAKVTCAHEFKHASNYSASGWTGWEELNATWAEDIVYPLTNDYWNYVNNNGPNILGQPWTSLDSGGVGSYEDCLWEHYLSGTHGTGIIVEVSAQLALGFNQKRAYLEALALYGSTWEDAYPGFLEWAWFTGSRSQPGFGFPDAPSLKRMNLNASAAAYPYVVGGNVAVLAGQPYRLNPGSATGAARIVVDGQDAYTNGAVVVSVIIKEAAGPFTIVRPPMDANNDCDYLVPLPFSALTYVGVVVTNAKRSGAASSYLLTVTDEAPTTDVVLSPGSVPDLLRLETANPNPFTSGTRIRFSAPRAEHATVKILDVQGRVVRTLLDGTVRAGENEVAWDGRDAAGRRLATGVYWTRVEAGRTSVAGKVTLLR